MDPDDVPTKPDATETETLGLVRIFGDLDRTDRARAVVLLRYWSRASIEQRVLIEALAREMVMRNT